MKPTATATGGCCELERREADVEKFGCVYADAAGFQFGCGVAISFAIIYIGGKDAIMFSLFGTSSHVHFAATVQSCFSA